MEHPVRDVRSVIRSLCQGTPQEQKDAINRYYLPSASLVHPFCRVPSFESFKVPVLGLEVNSRDIILGIFKCPKVDLEIESAVFDQRSSLLYLSISQVFSVWFIPFYKAPVRLVTVLHLVPSHQQHQHHSKNTNGHGNGTDHHHHNNNNTPNNIHHLNGTDEDEPSYAEVASGSAHPSSSPNPNHTHRPSPNTTNGGGSSSRGAGGGGGGPTRYLIKSQQDYYQINEFLKFLLGIPGAYLWSAWQIFSTILCILGAAIFSPLMNLTGLGAWLASGSKGGSSKVSVSVSVPSLPGLPSLSGLRGERDGEGRDKDATDGTAERQKAA